MRVLFITWLLGSLMEGQLDVPGYPPLALRGGNVIAVIAFSGGTSSRVQILYGDEPFVKPTREALAGWRVPAGRRDGPVLVVVNFRDPYLALDGVPGGVKIKPRSRSVDVKPPDPSLPGPLFIVDPLYSDTSRVVMGGSVLHLNVTALGSVSDVEVLAPLGDYTQATVDAVKNWKFTPARDSSGNPVASEAFAVCVFRPLIRNP